jgi:hypothetical protein
MTLLVFRIGINFITYKPTDRNENAPENRGVEVEARDDQEPFGLISV